MHSFFTPDLNPEMLSFQLPEEEAKHACKVLRMQIGDELNLLNGRGSSFLAEISEIGKKDCSLKIKSHTFEENSPYEIHVAIAPTKNQDRIEWFLEKATEIGVTEISLIHTKNTERKIVKEDRLTKILISAMKQSQRKYLPKLNSLISLKEFLALHKNGAVAHCYQGNKMSLNNVIQKAAYPILIGPEGDFSSDEIEIILKQNFDPISLGKNRLRTETAGLYACMLAKTIFE